MWRCLSRILLISSFVWLAASPREASGQTAGLDPAREIGHYSHRAWTKRDGLPQNSVLAIAQTHDGYLWFGTMEGLARFDGTSFSTLNTRNTPQFGTNYILSLLVDHDGALWVGTNGLGLVRIRNGEIKQLIGGSEQEHPVVVELKEDHNGDVWAAMNIGLGQFHGDSLLHMHTTADGLPTTNVYSVAEDTHGRVLAATPKGVWIRENGCFEPYIMHSMDLPASKSGVLQSHSVIEGALEVKAFITKLLCDRTGTLWLGTADKGLFVLKGSELKNACTQETLGHGRVSALFEDQRGTIWVGTTFGGLSRVVEGRLSRFASNEGLSGDEVLSIQEDREGVLWVGVATGGVNRFINSKFTTFHTGSSAVENMVWGVFVDPPGRLLASTASGGLVEYRNGIFVPTSIVAGAKSPGWISYALVQDRTGARWVASSSGVTRYSSKGEQTYPVGGSVALSEDRFGRVWAASSEGLWCFADDKMIRIVASDGESPSKLRSVNCDRFGNLWLAYRLNGVAKYRLPAPNGSSLVLDQKTAIHFTRREGLLSDWVTTMTVDSAGNAWVAPADGGLNVIRDSHVFTLSPAQGLPEEMLMGIAHDGLGSVWLTSNNGVCRISVGKLFDYFDGRASSVSVQSFGTSDGMYSDEFNGGYQGCYARTPDGKLWLPSTYGVVMVDPAHLPTNAVPPAIVLERVRIDKMEGIPRPNTEYPPGNGDLEFHFVGLSSNAPERIEFQYMLEGFNKEWIDAGSRREAFYTNIPPGTYRFRVIARNADGVWNDGGVTFPFVLRPRFTQTVWFGVLIGILILSLIIVIWFAYKRDRDRELQASQLESKLTHAQMQILEMQLQPHFLFNTLNGIMVLIKNEPDMASRMIARLSEFLRLTLESAGEQEVTLRRELDYLNRYVQIEQLRFGDRLTVEQHINPDDMEALVPNLILQPLVENAIRHGVSKRRGPAVIRVEAIRENGSLTIHIRDNGEGLRTTRGEGVKEGIGLKNTRSRLQYLYGDAQQCNLTSPPEGGVDVALTIPYHMQRVA
jgi:ligand-binding sensor domain-containing protein/two-component sensor histidine kinase